LWAEEGETMVKIGKCGVSVVVVLLLMSCGQIESKREACLPVLGKLGDDEFISIALRHFDAHVGIDGQLSDDQGVARFRLLYPRCCLVDRNPPAKGLFDRLDRVPGVEVRVAFPVRADRQSARGKFYEATAYLSNCGDVLDDSGSATSELREERLWAPPPSN
jgi:hypothetical protein